MGKPDGGQSRADQLAAIAAALCQPIKARQSAMDELVPFIERTATSVGRRYPLDREVRQLVRQEAPGLVWEKIADFRAEAGSFAAWCHAVLHNALVDRLRGDQRHKRLCKQLAEGIIHDDGGLAKRFAQADRAAPFRRADLDRIASQPVADRVIVLCLLGLWNKVPQPIWEEWTTLWAEQNGIDLPFPPGALVALHDGHDRKRWLAELLGITEGAISQRLCRARAWLKQLSYVRELNQ
jgi:DNA-directed RNA polymerase specialized sigma24 family protein